MSKRPKATGHRSRDSPPISRAGRSGFTGLFFLFLFFSFFFFFFRFFSFDFLLVSFGCFFVCCSSIFLFFFFLRVDPTRETRWRFSLDWFYRVCLFFLPSFLFFSLFFVLSGQLSVIESISIGFGCCCCCFFCYLERTANEISSFIIDDEKCGAWKKKTNKTNNNKTKENLKKTKIEASVSRQRSISGSRCFYWVLPSFFVISFFFRTTPRNNNDDDDNIVDG